MAQLILAGKLIPNMRVRETGRDHDVTILAVQDDPLSPTSVRVTYELPNGDVRSASFWRETQLQRQLTRAA